MRREREMMMTMIMIYCLLGYIAYKAVYKTNEIQRISLHGHKGRLFLSVTDIETAPRQYRKVFPPCLLTWVLSTKLITGLSIPHRTHHKHDSNTPRVRERERKRDRDRDREKQLTSNIEHKDPV